MDILEFEKLFEITATLDSEYLESDKLVAMINGGEVKGKINGTVLPIGSKYGVFLSSDTYKIDVRAAIQTDDGAVIYIYYGGFMHARPDKLKMLFTQEGKNLDPSEYYWRTNPIFETVSPKYSWLNHIVCVGCGSYTDDGKVLYKVYAIK